MYRGLTLTSNHIIYKEKKILQVLNTKDRLLIKSIEFNEEIKYLNFPFVSTSKDLFYISFNGDYKIYQVGKLNYPPTKILNIQTGNSNEYLLLDRWGDIYKLHIHINEIKSINTTLEKVFGNLTTNFDFNIQVCENNDQLVIKIFDKFRRIINFDLKGKKIISYEHNSCLLTFYNISNALKEYISGIIGNIKNISRVNFFDKNIYILTFDDLFIFNMKFLEEPKVINGVIDFIEGFYLNRNGEIVEINNSITIKTIEISENSIEEELKRASNCL